MTQILPIPKIIFEVNRTLREKAYHNNSGVTWNAENSNPWSNFNPWISRWIDKQIQPNPEFTELTANPKLLYTFCLTSSNCSTSLSWLSINCFISLPWNSFAWKWRSLYHNFNPRDQMRMTISLARLRVDKSCKSRSHLTTNSMIDSNQTLINFELVRFWWEAMTVDQSFRSLTGKA